jgi:amino acid adenylation domain-containing protein
VERLIGASCVQRRDHVAIRFGSNALTYGELASRSDRLADVLSARGVLRGDRVGVAVQRSHTLVETLLAVWKVGAAYVPLDPSFPSDRLSFMIKDAGLRVVLTSGEGLPDAVDLNGAEAVDVSVAVNDDVAPTATVEGLDGGDVAYVIYTSGSTGLPKGVEIEHRAAVNFLLSMRDEPGLSPDDVLLAVTTLSFDISVLELFLPLVVGAQVVIAARDDSMDGQRLAQLIQGSAATVMQATPTTWTMLFELGWTGTSGLRVLCGGEAMPPELASRLVATCGEVWNMFGPTETTVWSTVFRVTAAVAERGQIPIGHPIATTVCRVLDRDGEPVPIGVPGELLIGGAGLARGYLNRPELTAERFVADSLAPGGRLYRTGDLVRWRPDGTIEYLGRLDHQVKIRGFRIELGEIESALRAHAGLNDAVVIAEGSAASGRLLAYVIPVDVESPPAVVELRTWLQQRLPDYMVPSRFTPLEEFPLTPNRKIDRNALPWRSDSNRFTDTVYVAPRNDVEAVIAKVFATTLKLEQVSVDDNFFELGGHSLHATSVLSKLHAIFGVETDLRKFFIEPTVAHAAEVLTEDPEARSRVERVAAIRQRLDSMSPEDVRATLAARRSGGDEVGDDD